MVKFYWDKKGKIFNPDTISEYIQKYAQVPTPIELFDKVRIYFTTRPDKTTGEQFVSYISFIEVEKNDFSKILYVNKSPVLQLGSSGEFDEFGTMPGSVLFIPERNEYWLYYTGWTRMQSVPFNTAIGLAISTDNGYTFKRFGKGPIIGDIYNEPYIHNGPRVIRINEFSWLMWYHGGIKWLNNNGKMESVYVIMYATSKDGITWKRTGEQIIPSVVPDECQGTSPPIKFHDTYHLFFSYHPGINFRNKENGYRIGYAFSKDNLSWHRDDSMVGIDLSKEGWDSEMMCYPYVFKMKDKIYMLYCGNYFGRDGFGYAELKSASITI